MGTGAALVAQVIGRAHEPVVFGLPGGHTVPVFTALREHPEVRGVLTRIESTATFAAEAWARTTGRPAFVMGQGAWILGVGGAGILEAHLSSTPMVILTDMTEGGDNSHMGPYQGGAGGYGAYDLPQALQAITKRTFVARSAAQAAEMTQLAIIHATSGEPGPVAVIFHSQAVRGHDLHAPEQIDLERPLTSVHPVTPDESIMAAAAAINKASGPVAIIGNGARQASAQVRALLEEFDIPFATTAAGKSVVPETDPRNAGVLGAFGHNSASSVVGQADVVLAIGTKLGSTDLTDRNPVVLDGSRQRIIHIDAEPVNLGWTIRAEERLLGRIEDVLPRLSAHLEGSHDGSEHARRARESDPSWRVPQTLDADGRMNPRTLVSALARLLSPGTVVTCDAGENRLFMLHDFLSGEGVTVLQPNGAGPMGYAVPAALGVGVADPQQRTVAVLGDGGYAMSVGALMSAMDHGVDMFVLVLDNQALGWVLHEQGSGEHMARLEGFDYIAVSESLGARATTVRDLDELAAAVEAFVSEGGVHVALVEVSLTESFQTLRTDLAREA